MKLKYIITISGRISSGKSYYSKLLSRKLDIPIVSFGGFLKYYCKNKNIPVGRETLQNVGENLVKSNPAKFLNDVIEYNWNGSDRIILDGVRHKSILELIQTLTEKKISIYIDANTETRYNRFCERNNAIDNTKTFEKFLNIDTHNVEKEIETLKDYCDYVIDNTTDHSRKFIELLSLELS